MLSHKLEQGKTAALREFSYQVADFIEQPHEPGSMDEAIKRFLKEKLPTTSLSRMRGLFWGLAPMSKAMGNPTLSTLDETAVNAYIAKSAKSTGNNIRQFFCWVWKDQPEHQDFRTRKNKAAAYPKKLLDFLSGGQYPSGSYNAVLLRFIKKKRHELAYWSICRLFNSLHDLGEALDNPPIDSITYAHLRDYVNDLYLRYKPGTIKPIVGNIRQFFRWAKKKGYISNKPAKKLRGPGERQIARSAAPKASSEQDVRHVINHLTRALNHVVGRDIFGALTADPASVWEYGDIQILRDLFILVFLYETGGRAGELAHLSTKAMHEALYDEGVYTAFTTGKTGGVGLRFTAATAELWGIWQQVRPSGCEDFAVVSWSRGMQPKPMRTATIGRALARRCEQAHVRPFRAHALRHAKVTRSEKLVGLEVTSRLIGHSSIDVTRRYVSVDDTREKEAAVKTGLQFQLWGVP